MKKMNFFKAILLVIGLFFLNSFIIGSVFFFARNWPISYVIGYLLTIIILIKIFKNDLKECLHSFKDDLHDYHKKILPMTLLFYILVFITNFIMFKITGNIAENEKIMREELSSSFILMFMSLAFLAPITEEFIYRLPFRNCKKNPLLIYLLYSLLFASMHITQSNTLMEVLFIIPYFLLSLSIGYGFYKTKNIFTSIMIHIFNNILTIVLLLII